MLYIDHRKKDLLGAMEAHNQEKSIVFMEQLFKDISREDLAISLKTLVKMDRNI